MAQFTDASGKTRELSLDVFTVERIKQSVAFEDGSAVDLWSVAEEEIARYQDSQSGKKKQKPKKTTLQRITDNPVTLCQVIHCALGCDFEEFASAMNGDAIEDAADALNRELIGFFPRSLRPAALRAYEKGLELQTKLGAQALATIESTKFDNFMERQFQAFDVQLGKSLDDSE